MSLTPADIIAIIQAGGSVDIEPTGAIRITAGMDKKRARREQNRRAYERRQAAETALKPAENLLKPAESAQTPLSLAPSPLPLASPSPRPHTHTPAPTHTHEAGPVKASKPTQTELLTPAEEKPESVTLDFSLPAELHHAWREWQDYRQRRAAAKGKDKLAWTFQAARMGAMQIASYSQTHGSRIVCDRIASAIGGNWQGLNLDKMDRPRASQNAAPAAPNKVPVHNKWESIS